MKQHCFSQRFFRYIIKMLITPGKSNVMDAVSFAIGERAASLRVKHLRDLIHGAHIGKPVVGTARVAMRYCDDGDEETVFCRTIIGQFTEFSLHV